MEGQKDASRSLVDSVILEGRSGYSDLQQIVAFVIIAIGGLLSLLASLAIIYYIFTSVKLSQEHRRSDKSENDDDASGDGAKRKPHKTNKHHNDHLSPTTSSKMPCEMAVTLASAIFNVMTSGCFIFFDAFVPDDGFSSLYFFWNRGNDSTCKAMAFLQHLQLSNVYFGAAIALYYYMSMVKGDFRFDGQKKSQRTLLAVASGIPLVSAGLLVFAEGGTLIRPSGTLGCYIHEGFADTQQSTSILAWFLILTIFPIAFCVLFMVYAAIKIAIYIRHLRHVIDEMTEAAASKAKSDNQARGDSHSMRQLEVRITKMTNFVHLEKYGLTTVALHLTLAVVGNLFLIVSVATSFQQSANKDPPYVLRFLQSVFFPMAGWFRCWVFLRPRIAHYRTVDQQPISYFEATKRVLLFQAHSSDESEKRSGQGDSGLKRMQSADSSDVENFEDDDVPLGQTPAQDAAGIERSRPQNPRLKRLAQQQDQVQVPTRSIAPIVEDSHNGMWSYANENQARQLARAMYSRRGLQGLADDDSNADFHTRQLARAISSRRGFGASIRASSRGGLGGMRSSRRMIQSPSSTASATSSDRIRIQEKVRKEQEPGFPPTRTTEAFEGKEGQSSLRDNTYHHAKGQLGPDTSHTTGSWSKMEFSGHPDPKMVLYRSHRGDDGSRNSFSSVDSFAAEGTSRRLSSCEFTKSDMEEEAPQRRTSVGSEKDNSLSSWSSFSNTDIVLPKHETADLPTTNVEGPSNTSNEDDLSHTSENHAGAAEEEITDTHHPQRRDLRLSMVASTHSRLDSVIEADFEDSTNFNESALNLNASLRSLGVYKEETSPSQAVPAMRRRESLEDEYVQDSHVPLEKDISSDTPRETDRQLPSWSNMSSTDMLNQKPPDIAALMGHQQHAVRPQPATQKSSSLSVTSWAGIGIGDDQSSKLSLGTVDDSTLRSVSDEKSANRKPSAHPGVRQSAVSMDPLVELDKEDGSSSFHHESGPVHEVVMVPTPNSRFESQESWMVNSAETIGNIHEESSNANKPAQGSGHRTSIVSGVSGSQASSLGVTSWAVIGEGDSRSTIDLASTDKESSTRAEMREPKQDPTC